MKQYHDLLSYTLENGFEKGDRTGTGTKSVFGYQTRFDLRKGFPLLTTKFVSFENIVTELLWFLAGNTNTDFLREHGCNIWNAWALTQEIIEERDLNIETSTIYNVGDLGPVYGHQWRSWGGNYGFYECGGIDQIGEVIKLLKTKPDSRRLIVSAWNPDDLPDESISPQENVLNDKMALAPCHLLFQFYTREMTTEEKIDWLENENFELFADMGVNVSDIFNLDEKVNNFFNLNNLPKRYLSCQLYQRSADEFLGVPYNIASYSLLTHMIAQCVNMVPHEFIHTFGDAHIYSNHIAQVKELLSRDYEKYELPKLKLNPSIKDIDGFTHKDIHLMNYVSYDSIKAPIAI